jgi:Domain of unknown function (DUF1844)
MFIDQLEMIQEKTRGNLTNEETMVLRNTLSNLQMAYVEASGTARPAGAPETAAQPEAPRPAPSQPSSGAPEQSPPIASTEPESESRKKFTKSYGPNGGARSPSAPIAFSIHICDVHRATAIDGFKFFFF